MGFIDLVALRKSFGRSEVVKGLDLEIEKGELISFLGGSGCGKTTTLRMIAGFEEPSSGCLRIAGLDMRGVKPAKRHLGMVFQHYALFPNMTVRKNVAFGLRVEGVSKSATEAKVDQMLELIAMSEYADRYPHQLSGGQQQRVALARALAVEPGALLLDEPLSALDAKIRVKLREDIRAIQKRLGITTVYVTHDQEEALSISDRVAVMRGGVLEQVGSPSEIYDRPANSYVASFVGTINAIPCVIEDAEAATVRLGGEVIRTPGPLRGDLGREPCLRIRPEALRVEKRGYIPSPGENCLGGRLESLSFRGSVLRLGVSVFGQLILVDEFNEPGTRLPELGTELTLVFPVEACSIIREDPRMSPADTQPEASVL
jgi:ABC-type spermidine/putrescine transport systems, ATPase components